MSLSQKLIEDACVEIINSVGCYDISLKKIAKIIVRTFNIRKQSIKGEIRYYIFQDHSWKQLHGLMIVLNDMREKFQTIKLSTEKDNDARRSHLARLKTMGFCNNIKHEMINKMDIVEFDTNPLLMCCSNGVLDLEKGVFRDGLLEDYCFKSTRLTFKEPSAEEIERLDEWLSRTFPDKEMLNQVIDTFTHLLVNYGHNDSYRQNRCIFNKSDEHSSGQSTFQLLIRLVFGDYAIIVNKDGVRHNLGVTNHKLMLYHTNEMLCVGHIKSALAELHSPVWFNQFPDDINESIKHGTFRYHNKLNVLNFESAFVQPQRLKDEKYMSSFNKDQLHKGVVFEADNYKLDQLMASTLLWKLFQNHNTKIRRELVFQIERQVPLKKIDNCNRVPDIVTNSFDYVIAKCGRSKCIEYFINGTGVWSKARFIYHLQDIDVDIKFTIADFFIRV